MSCFRTKVWNHKGRTRITHNPCGRLTCEDHCKARRLDVLLDHLDDLPLPRSMYSRYFRDPKGHQAVRQQINRLRKRHDWEPGWLVVTISQDERLVVADVDLSSRSSVVRSMWPRAVTLNRIRTVVTERTPRRLTLSGTWKPSRDAKSNDSEWKFLGEKPADQMGLILENLGVKEGDPLDAGTELHIVEAITGYTSGWGDKRRDRDAGGDVE